MRKWSAWCLIAAGLSTAAKQYYDWIVLDRLSHQGYDAEITDYLFTAVPMIMAIAILGLYSGYKADSRKYGNAGLLMASAGNLLFSVSLAAEAWFSGAGIGYFSLLAGPGLILQIIGFLLFGLMAIRNKGIDPRIGWMSLVISFFTLAWPFVSFVTYNVSRDLDGQLISTRYGVPLAILWGLSWAALGFMTLRALQPLRSNFRYGLKK